MCSASGGGGKGHLLDASVGFAEHDVLGRCGKSAISYDLPDTPIYYSPVFNKVNPVKHKVPGLNVFYRDKASIGCD
jgi:hypothetical protein